MSKYGRKWFFNETGEATPFHEMGHVYANVKGLPKGFEQAAERWAKASGCDMLKKPGEAWAEAWAAYHTNNKDLPDYIADYIKAATTSNTGKIIKNSLIAFDDDAIMNAKIDEFSKKLLSGYVGKVIEVVCEGIDYDKQYFYGRSDMFAPEIDGRIYFSYDGVINQGEKYNVLIENSTEYDWYGRAEDELT